MHIIISSICLIIKIKEHRRHVQSEELNSYVHTVTDSLEKEKKVKIHGEKNEQIENKNIEFIKGITIYPRTDSSF